MRGAFSAVVLVMLSLCRGPVSDPFLNARRWKTLRLGSMPNRFQSYEESLHLQSLRKPSFSAPRGPVRIVVEYVRDLLALVGKGASDRALDVFASVMYKFVSALRDKSDAAVVL